MKLIGRTAICNFMGKRWSDVEKLILEENFPVRTVDGVLESDTDEITTWRLGRQKPTG